MAEKRKLSDLLDAYIQYQDNTEPPLLYKRWCGISLIAAALQRKVHARWGTLCFYPNFYIILVGPPGKARKGTAMRLMREHVEHLQLQIAAEATTREALIQSLAEAGMCNNMTDKPLAINLYQHSSMTIFSEELTSLIGYNSKELMANLADWFDCASKWTYRTKTAGVSEITNIFVNIIGATTPELLQATMPLDMIGGGLSSRILFIFAKGKGKRVVCPELSLEEKRLRDDVNHDLEQLYRMKGQFKYSKDFIEAWAEWYLNKPETCPLKSRFLHYYWERREVHLMKLAMICSASRSNEMVIRAADLARADDMLTEAEVFMPYAFHGMGHRDDAAIVSNIANTIVEMEETTVRILLQHFYTDLTLEQLHGILNLLSTKGFCKLVKGTDANWKVIHIKAEL